MKRFLTLIAVMGLAVGVMLIPTAALAAFGIDPGKVYVDNLYPGAEADYKITIYNQNDYEATFAITARGPDYTATDYEVFPYPEWITVTPDQATIKPGGQSDVLIVLIMPEDASYSGKKGETWISFKEQGTEGMIKIELCSGCSSAPGLRKQASRRPSAAMVPWASPPKLRSRNRGLPSPGLSPARCSERLSPGGRYFSWSGEESKYSFSEDESP